MYYQDSDSYVRHLRSRHGRLETIADVIGDRFALATDNNWTTNDKPLLAGQLAALKASLLGHIREEEEGGAVEEAVSRLPSLSAESRSIFEENDSLKEELIAIMELVADNKRVEATKRFRAFAIELKLHDEHEADLVQKGLNYFPY